MSEPLELCPMELGRISRPHGLRGEVEVRLHWPGSTSLLAAQEVLLSGPKGEASRRCTVKQARPTPKGVLLQLHEISDRTGAEQVQGWGVSVEREALPPLGEGEYYLCDVIGADVFGPDNGRIGRVVDLRLYPSIDALLIERTDGSFVEQPLAEPWLERVDVGARRVVLSSTEGMLDVEAEAVPTAAMPVEESPAERAPAVSTEGAALPVPGASRASAAGRRASRSARRAKRKERG